MDLRIKAFLPYAEDRPSGTFRLPKFGYVSPMRRTGL